MLSTGPQSPRQEFPNFGSGINTIAVRKELIGVRMPYATNTDIFGDGEPAEYVYEVVHGLVRSCKILVDGRRQITGFHMRGAAFGLELDDEHHFSAEAVNDTIILTVKRSAIMELAACDVYFARQLWAVTARDHRRVQNHIVILGCMKRQAAGRYLSAVHGSAQLRR